MRQPPPPGLTPDDLAIIRVKVCKHMRHGFNEQDREDACQEAAIHCLKALKKLDPARGNRQALINTVTERKTITHIKWLRAQKRHGSKPPCSLHAQDGTLIHEPQQPDRAPAPTDGPGLDDFLAGLTPELRRFALALIDDKPAKVQAGLGITRGKYRHLMGQLRKHAAAWRDGEKNLSNPDPNNNHFRGPRGS